MEHYERKDAKDFDTAKSDLGKAHLIPPSRPLLESSLLKDSREIPVRMGAPSLKHFESDLNTSFFENGSERCKRDIPGFGRVAFVVSSDPGEATRLILETEQEGVGHPRERIYFADRNLSLPKRIGIEAKLEAIDQEFDRCPERARGQLIELVRRGEVVELSSSTTCPIEDRFKAANHDIVGQLKPRQAQVSQRKSWSERIRGIGKGLRNFASMTYESALVLANYPFSFFPSIGRKGPTFTEFQNASSSEELQEVYRAKGINFKTETGFLSRVTRDWIREKRKYIWSQRGKSLAEILEPIVVRKPDAVYEIYGVTHHRKVGKGYVKKIESLPKEKPGGWTHEQELGEIFRGYENSVECLDHAVKGRSSNFLLGARLGVAGAMVLTVPLLGGAKLATTTWWRTGAASAVGTTTWWGTGAAVGVGIAATLGGMWLAWKGAFQISARCTSEVSGFVPRYIALERKLRSEDRLNSVERRSAYMAEYSRRVGEDRGNSVRRILCGAGHAAEIEYFLRHPLQDQEVQKLAQEHAEIASIGNEAVSSLQTEINKRFLREKKAGLYLGATYGTLVWAKEIGKVIAAGLMSSSQ